MHPRQSFFKVYSYLLLVMYPQHALVLGRDEKFSMYRNRVKCWTACLLQSWSSLASWISVVQPGRVSRTSPSC